MTPGSPPPRPKTMPESVAKVPPTPRPPPPPPVAPSFAAGSLPAPLLPSTEDEGKGGRASMAAPPPLPPLPSLFRLARVAWWATSAACSSLVEEGRGGRQCRGWEGRGGRQCRGWEGRGGEGRGGRQCRGPSRYSDAATPHLNSWKRRCTVHTVVGPSEPAAALRLRADEPLPAPPSPLLRSSSLPEEFSRAGTADGAAAESAPTCDRSSCTRTAYAV